MCQAHLKQTRHSKRVQKLNIQLIFAKALILILLYKNVDISAVKLSKSS